MPRPQLALSKPHILHVGKFYAPASGGIETHVHDLAVRQARVTPVSVVVANSAAHRETAEIEGVQVTRLAKIGSIASMPICPQLPMAIRRTPADLIHIHLPNPSSALAFLNSGQRGKLVVTHHADTLGRKALRRLSDPFVSRLMKIASRIIVTSERYLRSSEELRPFREKCCVIPLGINVDKRNSLTPEDVFELRRQEEERLIVAVGRLVPYKGFDVLIRAMKHVDGKLLLIGEGPEAESLRALAEREGVAHRVQMPGRVDDLRPYFYRAQLFALPSTTRAEAFGLVQLEAMATGLPVINTEIDSGVPEVSINGQTGFTVPPGNVGALSSAISLLLDRRDLRERFGAAAMARVQSGFSADRMAERTMALYRKVLAA